MALKGFHQALLARLPFLWLLRVTNCTVVNLRILESLVLL